jgi:hypothetical protein
LLEEKNLNFFKNFKKKFQKNLLFFFFFWGQQMQKVFRNIQGFFNVQKGMEIQENK